MMRFVVISMICSVIALNHAQANEVEIVDAQASRGANGVYRFNVTLRHADNGWDHYADRWDVLGPKGEVLGSRVLLHPHVTEQPFTRSLSGVVIPEALKTVNIRAHDKEHGDSPEMFKVTLPGR
jgi:hypothetical protein